MKARIKNSNEIVDVYFDYFFELWTVKGNSDIKFAPDALELLEEKDIDWEQRRYEIAKDMMAAFLSNYSDNIHSGNPDEQAKYAVVFADALIAELKKGGAQ